MSALSRLSLGQSLFSIEQGSTDPRFYPETEPGLRPDFGSLYSQNSTLFRRDSHSVLTSFLGLIKPQASGMILG